MHYLWLGKSLSDAIAAPILYVDGAMVVKAEPGFDEVQDDNKPSRVTPHLCSGSSSLSGLFRMF